MKKVCVKLVFPFNPGQPASVVFSLEADDSVFQNVPGNIALARAVHRALKLSSDDGIVYLAKGMALELVITPAARTLAQVINVYYVSNPTQSAEGPAMMIGRVEGHNFALASLVSFEALPETHPVARKILAEESGIVLPGGPNLKGLKIRGKV